MVTDFGMLFIGVAIMVAGFFILQGLTRLGEVLREVAAEDDLSDFYERD